MLRKVDTYEGKTCPLFGERHVFLIVSGYRYTVIRLVIPCTLYGNDVSGPVISDVLTFHRCGICFGCLH